MKETLELRVLEEHADLLFSPDEGKHLGSGVRLIVLPSSDSRLPQIVKLQRQLRRSRSFFFTAWSYSRKYSAQELASAECSRLTVTAVFEPAGEDCGTVYDESATCPYVFKTGEFTLPGRQAIKYQDWCGVGARQVSDLILDFRKIPKGKDIARTIAHEWIVSQRLAELLRGSGMRGFDLRPVRHKARYEDDPLKLESVKSGRELLRRVEQQSIPRSSCTFHGRIDQLEQRALMQEARREYAEIKRRSEMKNRGPQIPQWYQLVVTSEPVGVAGPPTQFGREPFNYDPEGAYRCPFGHVAGLNLLSEVTIKRVDWKNDNDIFRTKEMVGVRGGGVIRPRPILLISPRLYRLLRQEKVKGYRVEVAYLS